MTSRCKDLCDYIDGLEILSTHEHHRPFGMEQPSLEAVFQSGYVGWCGVGLENRARFLDLMSGNSYFVWYQKALDTLFDFGGEITAHNWDEISARMEVLTDPAFHEAVFTKKCLYSRAILDAYWEPGSDNGRPDLYSRTLRVNSFAYGWNLRAQDHNGNNAQVLYGKCTELDEYLAMMRAVIEKAKASGVIALKSALAYDRHLAFRTRDKASASRAFGKEDPSPEDVETFQDFIYGEICELAAEYGLPFQNHVGLGRLGGSCPTNLIPMIEAHPETKFVLFHMGYPWTEEVCALSHNYANVYPDLCWLPSIGSTATVRALHSLIETARDASRVCWGGDSWLVTESYAASLAMRWCLKQVLCDKLESGYLTEAAARRWAERILQVNARELYGIAD